MEFDQEILNCFCDEAIDLLARWEQVCLELAKSPTKEHFEELFRIAHNIKGGSRSVGLIHFGDFVHKVEDGITLLRDGKVIFTDEIMHLLLEAQKNLNDWALTAKIDINFNPDFTDFLNKFSHIVSIDRTNNSSLDKNTISEAVSQNENRTASSVVDIKKNESTDLKSKKTINNETIRISAQKLDQLIQVIGELSIHQSIIWHGRNENSSQSKMYANSLQLSQKLTKELYDRALSLRMQPLQSVFQRLERNISDLSRDLNKEVKVEVAGGEVELDKTVIEKIIDPMTHIVRNAIDHGIEKTEDREKSGKAVGGLIQIIARQDTFGVELVVKDDGKGLAAQKIRQKAIEKGLINENKVLSEKEIYNLIFLPGFSTAEKVTDVSGRGVGMDVVRRTLEDLHGSIVIDSVEGKGTTFTITLPTSVSIIDAMLIKISGHNYVIPVGAIEEVLTFDENDINFKKKMINYKDKVLPIQNLNTLLSSKNRYEKPDGHSQLNTVIICRHGENYLGFLIDKIIEQQQIVIRPLNENISGAFGILGGTILGNGEPGLIVDIPAVTNFYVNESRFKENVA